MAEFQVLHCADLHLDSPFVGIGHMDEETATWLRESTFNSFRRAIDQAIKRNVDLVTVAGDVYDSDDHGLHSAVSFRDQLSRLSEAKIPCCVVAGNHDPMSSQRLASALPAGCHLFSAEVGTHTVRHGEELVATVYGVSFGSSVVKGNLAAKLSDIYSAAPGLHIALLHCNVGSTSGHADYAPCSLDQLREASFDAWLLGHVHERKVLSPSDPLVIYPGNTQGRNIREAGERGVTLISFDGAGRPRTEFIPTSDVIWHQGQTSIDGLSELEQLVERLDEDFDRMLDIFSGANFMVVRWELNGRGDLHRVLADKRDELLETVRLRGRERQVPVWLEKLNHRTKPALDLKELRQQEGFVSMVMKCADANAADGLGREELLDRFSVLWKARDVTSHLSDLKSRVEDDPSATRALIDRAMLASVSALTDGTR